MKLIKICKCGSSHWNVYKDKGECGTWEVCAECGISVDWDYEEE